jgi:hypothetical protein
MQGNQFPNLPDQPAGQAQPAAPQGQQQQQFTPEQLAAAAAQLQAQQQPMQAPQPAAPPQQDQGQPQWANAPQTTTPPQQGQGQGQGQSQDLGPMVMTGLVEAGYSSFPDIPNGRYNLRVDYDSTKPRINHNDKSVAQGHAIAVLKWEITSPGTLHGVKFTTWEKPTKAYENEPGVSADVFYGLHALVPQAGILVQTQDGTGRPAPSLSAAQIRGINCSGEVKGRESTKGGKFYSVSGIGTPQ